MTCIMNTMSSVGPPQGFWGSGENSYLFSGSWGALVIILGELGSKLIILGIKGALPKSKKKNKEKPPFCLIFKKILLLLDPRPPLYIRNVITFLLTWSSRLIGERNMAIKFSW